MWICSTVTCRIKSWNELLVLEVQNVIVEEEILEVEEVRERGIPAFEMKEKA